MLFLRFCCAAKIGKEFSSFLQIKDTDPEDLMKLTKKGRTLMTFVKVSNKPKKEETEELTKLWQTSLWNNHIQAER